MASNYARYVDNAEEQGALESKLGVRPGTVVTVSASPIPNSNVIRIEVTGQDREVVTAAVATVARSLIQKVQDSVGASAASAAATLQQFTDLSKQVSAQQLAFDSATTALRTAGPSAPNLTELQQAASAAATQLSILKVQQDALAQKYRSEVSSGTANAITLTVVEDAVVTGDDRVARFQQFGLAGAVVGALVALLLAVARERVVARRARGNPGGPKEPGADRVRVVDEVAGDQELTTAAAGQGVV
jgi:hypothetical protein